jgi:GH25 family lysozyme M1 (1,4-beta-N-acetylmuramidase)
MKKIVDLSQWQPSKDIDWGVFAPNIDLLILRLQHGTPDTEYKNHVANAKAHNLPFLSYDFLTFSSVKAATVEAKEVISHQDSSSLGVMLDIEASYDENKQPTGITKLSNTVRLNGIKAFVKELRKANNKLVGAYIANQIYEDWGIDTIIDLFDFIVVPSYGKNDGDSDESARPEYPSDIWQYSSKGSVEGYQNDLDVSMFMNLAKPLEWFVGYYKVQLHDTLIKIAEEFHTTEDNLIKLNEIKDPNMIYINQIIKLR